MKFSLLHQSTGKVYYWAATTGHFMYRGFFKEMHINNINKIPDDKPVLIASNHPTAFIDPTVLGTYANPPIYYMTRGDIFRKPFFRKLMESINMFPVYRKRDGYGEKDRNDEVFEYCVERLSAKRVVCIYVEGEHHMDRRVRPIQKGLARIAFAAYERHRQEDLQVITTGFNYLYADRARDEVMINVGEPIYIKDYWSMYCESQGLAITKLGQAILASLKQICLHIDGPYDVLAEQLLTLHRSEQPQKHFSVIRYNTTRFAGEHAVIGRLNAQMEETKSGLEIQVGQYFNALDNAGIQDRHLVNPQLGNWPWLLFFALTFLPFLIGWVTAWPVAAVAKYVADKKVKKKEFYGSVIMGIGNFFGIAYYLLIIILSIFTFDPFIISIALVLPVLGWFSLIYSERWTDWVLARKVQNNPAAGSLMAMRTALKKAL